MLSKSLLKSTLFKVLDRLPEQWGFYLYHKIQDITFNRISIEHRVKAARGSFQIMRRILEQQQQDVSGKRIVEIGSGWLPIMPLLFKLEAGVEDIITYDLQQHYQKKRIRRLLEYFKEAQQFKGITQDPFGLPAFIKYHPHQDLTKTNLPPKTALVFSRFVLEHVSPTALNTMHRYLYEQTDPGTLILHLISPSDHRAYEDAALSHYDFLKYAQKEWDAIQTKFDYHNRLRLPQYLDIFKNQGFELLHVDYDGVDPQSQKYQKFKRLQLHPDFQAFTEEELLAGSLSVLLKKP